MNAVQNGGVGVKLRQASARGSKRFPILAVSLAAPRNLFAALREGLEIDASRVAATESADSSQLAQQY
jgi:hypothetical protein